MIATAAREAELARWDGSLVTFPADLFVDPPEGPVMVAVHLYGEPGVGPESVYQPMATMPTIADVLELVAIAARDWTRTHRRSLVLRARWLDEHEARAAWGDR